MKVLLIIYEIIQLILFIFLKIISLVFPHKKLKLFLNLRSPYSFYKKISSAFQNHKNHSPLYWFHVSSAGEMEQAIPVARKLNEKLGACFFVTYYSYSAEPFLKNFPAMIGSSGLPLDIQFVYKQLLKKLPLKKIFFVRYDIWPSLIFFCKKNNIEINLISATKIKTKKGLHADISRHWNNLFYKYFSNIFVVTKEDLVYFQKKLSHTSIYLAGDAKWTRALERAQLLVRTKNDSKFYNFIKYCNLIKNSGHKKILVIGSPHSQEYEIILKASQLKQNLFIIYAPHVVEPKSCQSLLLNLNNAGYNSILYTEFDLEKKTNSPNLIVIDQIGFLAEIYQVADAAIIGGGFDGQIHNVLEPAAFGVPVFFGPMFERAQEARELISSRAAKAFENERILFQFLCAWVNFETESSSSSSAEPDLETMRSNALHLFQNLPDSSEVIFNAIKKA